MKKELISIILPVYKVEKYIDKCLNSLVNQTYDNLEIILVDDGSPDNSGKLCDEWAKRDSRVKVIHKENGGVSDARNVGLDNATGDYIIFLDPDDYIELNTYEKMLNAIKNENADMSMCGIKHVYETTGVEENLVEENLVNMNENGQTYLLLNKQERRDGAIYTDTVMGSVCRCMIKKEFVGSTRFERVAICEDLIFVSDVLKKNPKIAIVNEYLYSYLQRATSAMHSVDMKKIESRIEATKMVYVRLKDYVDEAVMGASMFAVYSFCISRLMASYKTKEVKEFVKNNEFLNNQMNTKFNYNAQKKNVGFAKKIWYFFIHKKWFGLTKLFVKLVMKSRNK